MYYRLVSTLFDKGGVEGCLLLHGSAYLNESHYHIEIHDIILNLYSHVNTKMGTN